MKQTVYIGNLQSFLVSRLTTVTILFLLVSKTVGEPVQYCRFGHASPQDARVDLCLGITMHYNTSSEDYDMYLSMQVTRGSALGWTAAGTGSMMAGSLMFIIYGDPFSPEHDAPIVSIRTVDGHHQPRVLSQADMGGADLRLLQADWVPTNAAGVDNSQSHTSNQDLGSVAKVALVCYSCAKWPGTPISADSNSQPWIWAWNDRQEFDEYSDDVHLGVHKHHAGSGGWGRFYVDMARSIYKDTKPPSLPPIRPGVSTLGASESTDGWSWFTTDPVIHIHGLLLGAVFVAVFPVGVVAMRSGSTRAFQYHWIIQILASVFLWIGVTIGLLRARRINTSHQWIGLVVAACNIVQNVLGWRHHVLFLQIQRRQWASYGHIWLGRTFLLLGWTNVITGLLLTGHNSFWIATATIFILFVAVALVGWIWMASRQCMKHESLEESPLHSLAPTRDEYFAVAAEDDDGDDEFEFRSSNDNLVPATARKKETE